jgi:hypothetical protein
MDLQEVVCWSLDWIRLAQDRDRWRALVNAVRTFGIKCGEFLDWLKKDYFFEKDSVTWSK